METCRRWDRLLGLDLKREKVEVLGFVLAFSDSDLKRALVLLTGGQFLVTCRKPNGLLHL